MNSLHKKTLEIIKEDKENHLSIMHSEIIKNKFKNIVEFGVDRGTSTAAFLDAVEKTDGYVYSFDIKDCKELFSHDKWKFYKINDLNQQKIFTLFPKLNEGIDLLYIDSYHEPNHIKKLLEIYFPFLNKDGHIYVDDTSSYPYRQIKSVSNAIISDLSKEAVEEFFFSNFEEIDFQFNGGENGLCILKKTKDSKITNIKSIWKYNIFLYFFYKYVKKIKDKLFYKS